MTALSIIPLACMLSTGWASQYGPGVMDRVIDNRQAWGQLPDPLPFYDGFVAVPDCSLIGSTYHIRPVGSTDWERFLVADCAGRGDRQSDTDSRSGYQWMVSQNILVEVDYETAVRWGVVGRGIRVEKLET